MFTLPSMKKLFGSKIPDQQLEPIIEVQKVKILVTGTLGSGKSTFGATISEIAFVEGGSNLLDFARLTIDPNSVLYIFGTVGSRIISWDILQEIMAEEMLGFVIVIDSTSPESFRSARNLFEIFRNNVSLPYPLTLAANKQDKEGAWSVEDLRIVLRIPPEIPIIPCVATDKKSVANVLLALCEEVLREIDAEVEA